MSFYSLIVQIFDIFWWVTSLIWEKHINYILVYSQVYLLHVLEILNLVKC